MIINKSCISAFSKTRPFVALATKSKLFDPSFSLTSELILANYMTGKIYPPTTTDLKFCKLLWCETETKSYLVSGHENGIISLYELTDDGLVLVRSNEYMDGDVTALEYLPSKSVLVAGSCKGKIIFWTLTDLDKEYNLDIPISEHITSIAWNAKVSKILCVGTLDGLVRVLDIKKNSVIMTLPDKGIGEVRAIEWDSVTYTKLLVMSDKQYLLLFDLSADSVTHVGNHPNPLIGFKDDILISKNLIERGDIKIDIKDAFDASFSQRDSVIALSYADGTTEVFPIPAVPKRMPFCRKQDLLFSFGPALSQNAPLSDMDKALVVKKVVIATESSTDASGPFYKELVGMVRESKSNTDIAEFLLEKADEAEDDPGAHITIDLTDEETLKIIRGDLESLKQSKKSVDLSYTYAVLSGNVKELQNIEDFFIILVLSKIINDYSALLNIKNPRILAAVVLFYNILGDPSLSTSGNRGREFSAICSLVSKDFGKYIDGRMGLCDYHLGNIGNVNQVMTDLGDFVTGDVKLSSQCLIDYFWYKVFRGEYDDVKGLNIIDGDVEYYNRVMSGRGDKTIGFASSIPINAPFANATPRVTRVAVSENRNDNERPAWKSTNGVFQQGIQPSPSSVPNMPTTAQPQDYSLRQGQNVVVPPSSFARKIPTEHPASGSMGGYSIPPAAQQRPVMPAPSQVRNGYASAPQQSQQQVTFQSPNMARPNPSFPSAPLRSPAVPPSMGNMPVTMGYPVTGASPISRPSAGVVPSGPVAAGFPSGGIPSKSALEGFSRQRSPATNMVPMQASKPSPSNIPYPQVATTLEKLYVSNAQVQSPIDAVAIVKRFDSLVSMIKERAATKNSLIIKQRKNQHLNALAVYDTITKSTIPIGVLEVMDALCLRMENPDLSLKSDVDAIISKQNDCVWLKAFSELVKLLY